MAPLHTFVPRRFAPALAAAVVAASWWSLTIVLPLITADPAGIAHALSRLAAFAGLGGASRS